MPVWPARGFRHFIVFGHSAGDIMAPRLAPATRHRLALITESAQALVEDRTLQGIREAKATFTEPDQLALDAAVTPLRSRASFFRQTGLL